MTHILLIDDDTDLSAMLGEYLSVEHFIIDYAYDGRQGLKKTLTGKFIIALGYFLSLLTYNLPM